MSRWDAIALIVVVLTLGAVAAVKLLTEAGVFN